MNRTIAAALLLLGAVLLLLLPVGRSARRRLGRISQYQARDAELSGEVDRGLSKRSGRIRVVVLSASAALVGLALFGAPGAVAALVPPVAERALSRGRARRRHRRVAESIPEALEVLADAVRAKGSLRLGLGIAATSGPEAMRPAFAAACRRLEAGFALDHAIDAIRETESAPGIGEAMLALRLHLSSGGNLAAALDAVAESCRSRLSVERELAAVTSQGRFSGLVVAVAPLAFAVFAFATGLGGQFLLASPVGLVVLFSGLGLDLLGYLWMRRVCEIRW